MSERHFEQSMNPKEHIQSELEDAGISHPSEWRKALDLDTPLEGEDKLPREYLDIKDFAKIFTYLEGGARIHDSAKIERFGNLTDGLERLKALQSMSVAEATEAVRDFGLTPEAWNYLSRRLEFYQKFISGEATKKVNTQEYDDKKGQWVDVVKEEAIDASYASPETIKLGVIRDIYYAAMQGTPEMDAVKVATNRINREIEQRKQNPNSNQRSSQSSIRSVVQFFGYYSGIFEGSLGQYPDLSQLYQQCKKEIEKRFGQNNLDEKELEHKAVLLTARRLEGAFNYNGVLDTSASPYSAGFKESVTVGQLGHQVMRQMRGMRSRIQETNFSRAERFIGKSGDNRYRFEKKRIGNDVKALEDFVQDNQGWDASHWSVKKEGGTEEQIKGRQAAELMTQQKNNEAVQRAERLFEREKEKINRWFEKSKTKIASYTDVTEEARQTIYDNVQFRYNEKMVALQQEYEQERARLENRTPEDLLSTLKERQEIVNKRFEKRKSLAQKALDLHFHFNHQGREYGSKPFNQIDWVNNAPFGIIKRAHRALSNGIDDQTIMMRALAEVNGESVEDQNPEKFVLNIIKSGNAYQVIQNFEKFSGITEDQHLTILLAIIRSGAGRNNIVKSLDKFTGVKPENHLQIVQVMNESGAGGEVVSNLDKFSGIKSEDKRSILFGAIKGGGVYQVAQNLENFSDILTVQDHRDIVMEMIKAGNAYYLNYGNVLDKFTGLEDSLRQVIKAGKYEALPHVLEAGFTIEEITRFPFLISPLVTKK